jgi:steroid delta-isomerase-like uncharacterized protein
MSIEANKLVFRQFIGETLNKGNVDAAADYVAESVIKFAPFPGQGTGLSGLKQVLLGMRIAFPDMHRTIEEQIAEADRVLTRFIWTGTHEAEFLGAPAKGRQVSVWGMVIDRLESEKIKETKILMDTLGLMRQM